MTIHTSSITLGAFLKWAGEAQTGGQAKAMVAHGQVRVNGAKESRRGRRLLDGDQIQVVGRGTMIVVSS